MFEMSHMRGGGRPAVVRCTSLCHQSYALISDLPYLVHCVYSVCHRVYSDFSLI